MTPEKVIEQVKKYGFDEFIKNFHDQQPISGNLLISLAEIDSEMASIIDKADSALDTLDFCAMEMRDLAKDYERPKDE